DANDGTTSMDSIGFTRMNERVQIRPEQPDDIAAIRRVNERAFDSPAEADLVDLLRERSKVTLSLVAVHEGQVVGHILFSPVVIEATEQSVAAVGLAPIAMLPKWQNQVVGSLLAKAGLDGSPRLGHRATPGPARA